ncbi:ABC transporter ATP-binding protein [Candidatus Lucifugimonas marina]|uniref:ATP-binding cassette domain-containing protein n=1 Tax=Candidatus Lucifugimonas marina TaxID=3038979 RepID=A0AAJ5ZCA5_9CHLR|nr:ATP-binding cassette domain-containing protein [SAR202 cluster bacterium JH702]MDG0870703.1 ATP-binding cassette domain-containing protein [SAR202 cluster bacterium JH639]WFG34787.1 ATP-binding cassette domain-containing protein [SAR202 cluster bacterium JH545]WFG38727.1 ATP-binding cassette domain-containing protein [SAR202 cluster bacterium JH1073]
MTNEAAILAEGLTKHYGEIRALNNLGLAVQPGEVFGFLGPNGAGKTTAIRTLMDEIRPTAGRASILGLDTHDKSVEIRRHIGYLPGDLAMYPGLTGQDTLKYFANLRGGVDWSYVEVLAERLNADLSKKVGNLSSGNRQKIGLIQAFMNRPEVIIMDEPSSGLDPLVQREFQTILRELAAEGNSVFLSSHTLSEVQRVADRVGIIRGGDLITVETVSSLRSKAMRRVEFEFGSDADSSVFSDISGVSNVVIEGRRIVLSYDGTMDVLLKAAMDHNDTVVDITTHEADLEDIFLTYYEDSAEDKGGSAS